LQFIDFEWEKSLVLAAPHNGGDSWRVGLKCERALTHKVIHNPL
jgi:hypothetical protein